MNRFPIFLLLLLSVLFSISLAIAAPIDNTLNSKPDSRLPAPDLKGLPSELTPIIQATDETDVTIQVGTGTATARYPITEYYWFTRTQALFTASEIGSAGLITKLRWYPTVARTWTNTGGSNAVRIFLGTTSLTALTASTYSTSGMTQVYQNTAYTGVSTAEAWQEFDINDFYYNGTDNLLIVTQIDLGGWAIPSTGEAYRSTAAAALRFQTWETDNTPPTGTGTLGYYRPNIQFEFSTSSPAAPTLTAPTNGATLVAVNSTLSWTTGVFTDNVDVYFGTNQALVTSLDTTVRVLSASTATSYDPPGDLAEGATYYWRVVARNTTSGEVASSSIYSFTTFSPPLSGTKTIGGTNPSYATFTDAINALIAYGVAAPGVTFNVRPGTYNERLIIPAITGAGATAHVVFQKESSDVTIATAGTSGSEAIVKLNGADYIEFRGINLTDVGTSTTDYVEYGYWLTNPTATNGAQHNVISGSTITLHRLNAAYGVFQSITTTPTAVTGANSYNSFLDLRITNCTIGVYTVGNSSYHDLNTEIGSSVAGLTNPNRMIIGSGGINDDIGYSGSSYAIYVSNQEVLRIHDLDIQNVFTSSASGSIYGIYLANTYGATEVFNNRISNLRNESGDINATGSITGILLNPSTGSGNELRCYNNTVSGFIHPRTTEVASRYLTGIVASSGTVYIDHNTILINPTTAGSSSSCVYISTTVYLRNNILVNSTPSQYSSAKHYAIFNNGTLTSNYNSIYLPNLYGAYVGYYSSTDRATLDDWRAYASQDNQSVEGNPWFLNESINDLRITPGSFSPVNNVATPIAYVTTDIEGNTRNASTPDIGADEGVFVSTTFINGTKTIGGTAPDYATFQDAIRAVAEYGVGTGGVTFNVRAGTYMGAVTRSGSSRVVRPFSHRIPKGKRNGNRNGRPELPVCRMR